MWGSRSPSESPGHSPQRHEPGEVSAWLCTPRQLPLSASPNLTHTTDQEFSEGSRETACGLPTRILSAHLLATWWPWTPLVSSQPSSPGVLRAMISPNEEDTQPECGLTSACVPSCWDLGPLSPAFSKSLQQPVAIALCTLVITVKVQQEGWSGVSLVDERKLP